MKSFRTSSLTPCVRALAKSRRLISGATCKAGVTWITPVEHSPVVAALNEANAGGVDGAGSETVGSDLINCLSASDSPPEVVLVSIDPESEHSPSSLVPAIRMFIEVLACMLTGN